MNTATFILSTGRCGTQWIAANLAAAGNGAAVVEHEPLHDRYYPRVMLAGNDLDATGNAAEILAHCDRIEAILQDKPYVECGWPAWGAIPYLLQRFSGRIKIVHLVRHPVPVACSWVSHRAFCPPVIVGQPGFREKILASPFDDGTTFTHYRDAWGGMNPYEKSLFFWLEVNALGLRLETDSGVPWLRIRFEDLFCGNALQDLADFLGHAAGGDLLGAALDVNKDEYRHVCDSWWNPQHIRRQPDVIAVAERLGYDPLDFDELKLRNRYFPF